jgi:hypothetical protein
MVMPSAINTSKRENPAERSVEAAGFRMTAI